MSIEFDELEKGLYEEDANSADLSSLLMGSDDYDYSDEDSYELASLVEEDGVSSVDEDVYGEGSIYDDSSSDTETETETEEESSPTVLVDELSDDETDIDLELDLDSEVVVADTPTTEDVVVNSVVDKEEMREKLLERALQEMEMLAHDEFDAAIYIIVNRDKNLSKFKVDAITRLTNFSFVDGALDNNSETYRHYLDELAKRSFDIYFELSGTGNLKHVGRLLPTQIRSFLDKTKDFELRLEVNNEVLDLGYLLAFEVI